MPLVFGMTFDSISLVELIPQAAAKDMVLRAQDMADAQEYVNALATLSTAFDWLLDDYANRKRGAYDRTPFTFDDLTIIDFEAGNRAANERTDIARGLRDIVRRQNQELKLLQQRMTILSTGLDYRRYAKFSMLVPAIVKYMNGTERIVPKPGLISTTDHYEQCKAFVIYAALHLAAEDFDLDLHELKRNAIAAQRAQKAADAATAAASSS